MTSAEGCGEGHHARRPVTSPTHEERGAECHDEADCEGHGRARPRAVLEVLEERDRVTARRRTRGAATPPGPARRRAAARVSIFHDARGPGNSGVDGVGAVLRDACTMQECAAARRRPRGCCGPRSSARSGGRRRRGAASASCPSRCRATGGWPGRAAASRPRRAQDRGARRAAPRRRRLRSRPAAANRRASAADRRRRDRSRARAESGSSSRAAPRGSRRARARSAS